MLAGLLPGTRVISRTLWVRLPDMAGMDGAPEAAEFRLAIAMITPEYL
jgi:hypothetical protein